MTSSSLQQIAGAKTNTGVEVVPLTLHIGAEIRGVDLTRPLPPEQLQEMLTPYPAELMESFPVSTVVNSPRNEGPQLIQRFDPPQTTLFD